MRTLSASALAEIAKNFGTEPVNIVEIQWVDGGGLSTYADKKIAATKTIQGRIQELSPLDSVIGVSLGTESQAISLTLDDHDGTIKSIFDNNDIHKRPVWVYQWFEGLDLSDRFLLFKGQINSPFTWHEGDRTFRFEVVNQLEEKEIGFSPEEGEFPNIPASLIGVPWPMMFGTVIDAPTIRINKTISGTTQEGVGIVSGKDEHKNAPVSSGNSRQIALGKQLAMLSQQISLNEVAANQWDVFAGHAASDLIGAPTVILKGPGVNQQRAVSPGAAARIQAQNQASVYRNQANELRSQSNKAVLQALGGSGSVTSQRDDDVIEFQNSEGPDVLHILGGEDFPQGTPVTININGGLFTGTFDCQEFRITSRSHPENEVKVADAVAQAADVETSPSDSTNFDMSIQGPQGPITRSGIILSDPVVRRNLPGQIAQQFWADAGSRVSLEDDLDQYYIVSIVPGAVKEVKAHKDFEGIRRLVNVPSNLWEELTFNFGAISVVMVKLTKQLSSITDQGWDDDVHVTFESSVGPNTVDIMEYLIDTYSDLSTDTASFASVKTKLDPFPSNFALYDRPQIIDILRDIAFQARCAMFVKNDTVFLKYLPEEPISIATITDSDVDLNSAVVSMSETESIVTKMVVKWRNTLEDGVDAKQMIFRHNVGKYGIIEREFDWFIYNQPDIIRKAATFWLIRLSNTWKRISFEASLNLLNVETFDAVTIGGDIGGFVANSPVLSIVEEATYNSDNHTIQFDCRLPVKTGEMTPYQFFWPASQSGDFPTPGDFAGGDNIGSGVSGVLPIVGSLGGDCPDGGAIIIGGPNIQFVGPADLGDPQPADTGFQAQDIILPGTDFTLDVTPQPTVNLDAVYEPDGIQFEPIPPVIQGMGINIETTPLFDPTSGRTTTFRALIRGITENGIVVDTDARFGDGVNESTFDFEFDTEDEVWGAGTAFLEED